MRVGCGCAEVVNLWVWLPFFFHFSFRFVSRFTSTPILPNISVHRTGNDTEVAVYACSM